MHFSIRLIASTPRIRPAVLPALLAGLLLAAAAPARGASITWGAAQNISGDTDVSTTGTLVGAFHVGGQGVATTTVNGVTFQAFALSGKSTTSGNFTFSDTALLVGANGAGSANAPFTNLSASYQALLSTTGGGLNVTQLLTMSGLTIGRTYQFEFWDNFSPGSSAGNTTALAGNSVNVSSNTTNANGGLGQFAIGTFTADATSEAITFSASNTVDLNAFQLRDTTPGVIGSGVPLPPAVWPGLVTAAALACFAVQRRLA